MSEEVLTWSTYDEYMILDGGLDHRTVVDECPKCAAIVRSDSRSKHEAVCWHPRKEIVPIVAETLASLNKMGLR